MIKWKVKDIIEAVEKALSANPTPGNNQLLQQLKEKTKQIGGKPPATTPWTR